jgi:hypothetical protein
LHKPEAVQMSCKERTRLEKEHDQATAAFDAKRKALRERIGVCPRKEFASLSQALDQAWDDIHSTRLMLDEHIRQHGCI